MSSAKNYTIVFNQGSQQGRSLKMAASNILSEEGTPSISDYYQHKFRKRTNLEEIGEDDHESEVQKNNFVAPKKAKKMSEKQSASREKLVKGTEGWRRESESAKELSREEAQPLGKPNYTPNIPKPRRQHDK